jgi:DNA-binding MarR family transcriptional regulator
MDDDRTRLDEDRARRQALFRRQHVAATAFLHEILLTAEAIERARTLSGQPAMHLEPRSRVLRAIERCGGAPTFTDLGRLLGISRQAAREHALAAVEAGVVELYQPPNDRRAWQVALTPAGRRVLEQQRMPQFAWFDTLLGGLKPAAMRSTEHVLHVIRMRLEHLERDARELSAASARR